MKTGARLALLAMAMLKLCGCADPSGDCTKSGDCPRGEYCDHGTCKVKGTK